MNFHVIVMRTVSIHKTEAAARRALRKVKNEKGTVSTIGMVINVPQATALPEVDLAPLRAARKASDAKLYGEKR